jgi:hypothetical protein
LVTSIPGTASWTLRPFSPTTLQKAPRPTTVAPSSLASLAPWMARFTAKSGLALIWWGKRGAEMRWQRISRPSAVLTPRTSPTFMGRKSSARRSIQACLRRRRRTRGLIQRKRGLCQKSSTVRGWMRKAQTTCLSEGSGRGSPSLGSVPSRIRPRFSL